MVKIEQSSVPNCKQYYSIYSAPLVVRNHKQTCKNGPQQEGTMWPTGKTGAQVLHPHRKPRR